MRVLHGVYRRVFVLVALVCLGAYFAAPSVGIHSQRVVLPAAIALTAVAVGAQMLPWLRARRLTAKAARLSAAGRTDEAIAAYDECVERFGNDRDLQPGVAWALYSKGYDLDRLDRSEEALVAFTELLTRFGDQNVPALQARVAEALFAKGGSLKKLGRDEEQVSAYRELIERFGSSWESSTRDAVAGALVNEGLSLARQGRLEEAIATTDEAIRRFGDASRLHLRVQVARALRTRASGCSSSTAPTRHSRSATRSFPGSDGPKNRSCAKKSPRLCPTSRGP